MKVFCPYIALIPAATQHQYVHFPLLTVPPLHFMPQTGTYRQRDSLQNSGIFGHHGRIRQFFYINVPYATCMPTQKRSFIPCVHHISPLSSVNILYRVLCATTEGGAIPYRRARASSVKGGCRRLEIRIITIYTPQSL